jgi:cell division protein FtsL
MSPEPHLPTANSPAVQEPFEEWPSRRHHRRKRRRFSRRKVKKVVRLTLIVALHVIAIAALIYIWLKFAYSPGFTG